MESTDLGKVAYAAYGKATNFRDPNGNPLPVWDVLPGKWKEAFAATAEAVLNADGAARATLEAPVVDVLPFEEITWHKRITPEQRPVPIPSDMRR